MYICLYCTNVYMTVFHSLSYVTEGVFRGDGYVTEGVSCGDGCVPKTERVRINCTNAVTLIIA
jgi:hypothetical protein